MTLFALTGKTAYVTGGSGLIGRATCNALLTQGATVVSLDPDTATPIDNVTTEAFDITDTNALDATTGTLFDRYGAADIWVNCAYPRPENYYMRDPAQVTSGEWRQAVTLLLDSYCLSAATAARLMATAGKKGSIVNLSSIYGHVGPDFSLYDDSEITPTPPPYAAIKGGILAHSRYLACQYGPQGIRVNTVSPGGVEAGQDATFQQRYNATTPLRRMADAQDVAAAIAFLCSDAASYITGIDLPVDGGRLAQ